MNKFEFISGMVAVGGCVAIFRVPGLIMIPGYFSFMEFCIFVCLGFLLVLQFSSTSWKLYRAKLTQTTHLDATDDYPVTD